MYTNNKLLEEQVEYGGFGSKWVREGIRKEW
jgi:hypothetical protein